METVRGFAWRVRLHSVSLKMSDPNPRNEGNEMSRDLNKADIDNYITGHWGEDQFRDQPEDEGQPEKTEDDERPKSKLSRRKK